MDILKTFILILIIIVTLCTAITKPRPHKQFILESSGFKLESNSQLPQDLQSTSLFKIGDIKNNNISVSTNTQTEEDNYSLQQDTDEISYGQTSVQTSKSSNSNKSSVDRFSEMERLFYGDEASQNSTGSNSNSELAQVVDMLSDNSNAWAEMEKRFNEERKRNEEKYRPKSGAKPNAAANNIDRRNKSNNRKSKNTQGSDILSGGGACPICGDDTDPRYKDELLAWNAWRSRIQNTIMDTSEIDAHYGTIYYFSFKVDKHRNISNIRVICTDFSNTQSINEVRKAINNLRGKPILEFPMGTQRQIVNFQGGFLIGTYSQYSSPSDYHDYESIRTRY